MNKLNKTSREKVIIALDLLDAREEKRDTEDLFEIIKEKGIIAKLCERFANLQISYDNGNYIFRVGKKYYFLNQDGSEKFSKDLIDIEKLKTIVDDFNFIETINIFLLHDLFKINNILLL